MAGIPCIETVGCVLGSVNGLVPTGGESAGRMAVGRTQAVGRKEAVVGDAVSIGVMPIFREAHR